MDENVKKTYVLMVTSKKLLRPLLEATTPQGSIDIQCSIEEFPVAVSDDYDILVEYAKELMEKYPNIVGWNTRIVLNFND